MTNREFHNRLITMQRAQSAATTAEARRFWAARIVELNRERRSTRQRARNVAINTEVFNTTRREGENRRGSTDARATDWRADGGTVTHANPTRGR